MAHGDDPRQHAPTQQPTAGGSSVTGRSLVIWSLASVVLLGASGFVRSAQADRSQREADVEVLPPFPLSSIPRTLGDWKVVEGSEVLLDPLTTRITGSTDHIVRTYYDQLTGVTLSALVLYGPAEPVLPHTPQVCYPASGFRAVGDTSDTAIRIGSATNATFRTAVFSKSGGRSMIHQEVYHSYRYDDLWSPTIGDTKIPRHKSGIFKVQIQRRVTENEKRGSDESIESFVKALLPTLETMIRDSAGRPPVVVPAA